MSPRVSDQDREHDLPAARAAAESDPRQRSALVVEHEPATRTQLRILLHAYGFGGHDACSGREGAFLAARKSPDLVLLDAELPDMSSVAVLETIRRSSQAPIIALSAHASEQQKVLLLDAGADDIVLKPFASSELLARIRAAMRRSAPRESSRRSRLSAAGGIALDFDAHRVSVAGRDVHLTPTEFRLLGVLIGSAGRVVSHRELLHEVWGAHAVNRVEYLRVFIRQLRQKLESSPDAPRYLLTEPSVGYRLCGAPSSG